MQDRKSVQETCLEIPFDKFLRNIGVSKTASFKGIFHSKMKNLLLFTQINKDICHADQVKIGMFIASFLNNNSVECQK